MKVKGIDPLILKVRAAIKGMDEKDVVAMLLAAGIEISMATKIAASRYRAGGLRDKTRESLEIFLSSLVKAS